jgi:hypothetical protein
MTTRSPWYAARFSVSAKDSLTSLAATRRFMSAAEARLRI